MSRLPIILLVLNVMIHSSAALESPPNILLIIADDLGIGDVGCFGNDTIRTPNIDRIAAEGVKLTHHLSAASMCTPSRAALMTGRYPIRFGMVPRDALRVNFFLSTTSGLPPNETTVGELAQKAGYSTGIIGKWHLGMNCETHGDFCHHPLNQGFDYYYGVPLTNLKDFGEDGLSIMYGRNPKLPQIQLGIFLAGLIFALTLKKMNFIGLRGVLVLVVLSLLPFLVVQYLLFTFKYLTAAVMRNFDVVEQPIRFEGFTKRLVREGEQFLEKRHNDSKPFLLVMSWIQVHTALHAADPFRGRSAHGPYGDEVEEMDWSVGEILKALDKFQMADNTFVFFTSDHGGHNEETGINGNREGGWNGIYRGGKGQGGMDGGIRVPTVARWPGVIPPGTVVKVPTSTLDVLPTVAKMIKAKLPKGRKIDGKDILPLLKGLDVPPPHKFLVHYCGDKIHAARFVPGDGTNIYKIFLATPKWLPGTQGCGFICDCDGPMVNWHSIPLLYDVARDPSEWHRLDAGNSFTRNLLWQIMDLLEEHKKGVVPVESQFTHAKMVPRPWLQPCCGTFPFCSCVEGQ